MYAPGIRDKLHVRVDYEMALGVWTGYTDHWASLGVLT